ncbi:MAG: tRNA (N6-isopentenyl adenosine(37)-C2)-methylthiotransferase MiaB [Elusimicrobiota bacterium]
MKKFYIKTFGCQMNVYDSRLISDLLEEKGLSAVDDMNNADVIVINTCAVRQLAENKAASELGRCKKLKKKNPDLIIAFVGCVAQKDGANILKRFPYIDLVMGTKDMYRLPQLLDDIKIKGPILLTNIAQKTGNFRSNKADGVIGYVTVIRGCANFCSYCIVPHVRGKEESRSIKEIIKESKTLVDTGVKEIMFLGQNINAFGMDTGERLEDLLEQADKINGLERLRIMTSHPKSVTKNFIQSMADIPKACEHIHMPFQSGSDKILKEMNRKYTRGEYIDKVAMIRKIIPNCAITVDIIVGYPNETERDFEETLDLVRLCRFDSAFTFKYSPRQGTKAYKLKDNVSKEIKEARLAELNDLCREVAKKKNNEYVGQDVQVMWESVKKTNQGKFLLGKTRSFKQVFAPYKRRSPGKLEIVHISSATPFALRCDL